MKYDSDTMEMMENTAPMPTPEERQKIKLAEILVSLNRMDAEYEITVDNVTYARKKRIVR